MRRALIWFLAWSLLAALAVAAAAVALSGVIARREALRDAVATARAVADAIVVPLADNDFHARTPGAMADMSRALSDRSRDGSITHIKLWGDAGSGRATVLWSDEKPLVGRTFTLEPEEYALFASQGTMAAVSDLEKEENVLEQQHEQLVEVYAGLIDAASAPILFEAYVSTDALQRDARSLFLSILPLPLGVIVLLCVATLPLAMSLARRVDRGQQQMRRLLINTFASSDLERRRVARNLHDEVIQDLAGVGYALAAEARHLPEGEERAHLEQAHGIVARDLEALRNLMTDIYPPDLDQGGLAVALHSLVEHSDFGAATVTVQVQDDLRPTPLGARVAYRLIREVLRNAALHAHAQSVYVRVGRRAGLLEFEVTDDGIGFDPEGGSPDGHLGLRLVREMAADAGGRVSFHSAPGQGSRVTGEIPL